MARDLTLYDALLAIRDDPIVRLNRAVALAETGGPEAGLAEVDSLTHAGLAAFLPYHAVRADLLARLGLIEAAREAYAAALACQPDDAERRWLEGRLAASHSRPISMSSSGGSNGSSPEPG